MITSVEIKKLVNFAKFCQFFEKSQNLVKNDTPGLREIWYIAAKKSYFN